LIAEVRASAGLTQIELAQRAGTSQAAVARYESRKVSPSTSTLIRLLRAAGLELEVRIRKSHLSNLSGDRAKKLRQLRGEIISHMREHGASNPRIFGSVARGDDDKNSDIDLLVDFDISQGLVPIARLSHELSILLGEKVDVAPVKMLRPSVAKSALAEAVPL
jgi:predicted nucleotidyltransferase/DNA-binding XRE family transcriptional regulator